MAFLDFAWVCRLNQAIGISDHLPPSPTISHHLRPSPTVSLHLPPSPTISHHLPPSPCCLTQAIGISDEIMLLLGDEVAQDFVYGEAALLFTLPVVLGPLVTRGHPR